MASAKVRRRFPSPIDLLQLLKFRKPIFNGRKRRLSRALTIYDLRVIAKRRTPKAPFDYTDGGADSESSLLRARTAFENLEFSPRVLRDVKDIDLTVNMLGKTSSMPIGIAPTGFTRMMQTEGEYAGACAARDAGIPYTLSTMGTRSIEDVARVAPDGRNWFQLYMWKDRDRSMALVERAKKAGFDTLVLTVDVPVAGARLRDVRNGMTIPPSLTSKTILNAIPRPAWWLNFLTTDPLKFASLDSWNGTVAELLDSMFDPTVTYEDLKWIRSQWQGNLVVKGIQNVDDAVKSIEAGADAIILSNHGGRQLDRAPVPFYLLPEVVKYRPVAEIPLIIFRLLVLG
jgi:L-lactate dehydrogenase (cytochrome)/glycolate oxidase